MQRREEIKKDDAREEERDPKPTRVIIEQRDRAPEDWLPVITEDWIWCEMCNMTHPIGSHVR